VSRWKIVAVLAQKKTFKLTFVGVSIIAWDNRDSAVRSLRR
jgi:hypothetical protein